MNARNAFISAAALWLLASAVPLRAAGRLLLEASVEPRETTIGGRFVLTVRVAADDGVQVRPFEVPKTLGPFEVASFDPGAPVKTAGKTEQTFRWTLAIFDVGVSTIPPVAFRYRRNGGREETQSTPGIPVTVKSVLPPDAKDLRGLKGRLSKVVNWPVVFGLAGAALLGALGYWLWTRRGRRAAPLPPGPPPRPAHETALEALDGLEKELAAPGKIYYSRLSDILRAYLEGRFALPALDRTTSEIAAAFKTMSFPVEIKLALRDALDTSDLAKFAKIEPDAEERLKHLGIVRNFVQSTRPEPAPAEVPR